MVGGFDKTHQVETRQFMFYSNLLDGLHIMITLAISELKVSWIFSHSQFHLIDVSNEICLLVYRETQSSHA